MMAMNELGKMFGQTAGDVVIAAASSNTGTPKVAPPHMLSG
jgi:hypothetical protein